MEDRMDKRTALRILRKAFVLAGNGVVYLPVKEGWKAGTTTQGAIDWLCAHGFVVKA